jgi:DNA ligase (NAD+)
MLTREKAEESRDHLLFKLRTGKKWDDFDRRSAKALLEYAADAYYNTGRPVLADNEFDELVRAYRAIPGLPKPSLAPPPPEGGLRMEHADPALLGSLSNVYDADELEDWIRGLDVSVDSQLLASVKYDGCSVALDIEDDRVVRAYTRGQDGVGLDLSRIFAGGVACMEQGVRKLTLKCECVMTWADFEAYCAECGESYANPRTAVSGLFSAKDAPRWAKYMTLVALDYSTQHDTPRLERLEVMDGMAAGSEGVNPWKLITLDCWILRYSPGGDIEVDGEDGPMGLGEFYRLGSTTIRESLDVMADGLVFELMDSHQRNRIGSIQSDGKTLPKWAIAAKFPHKCAATWLESVEWDVANSVSGRVTPCAMITPVTIDGKEYRRVSLSNISRLRNEEFRIRGRVTLTIRGDVLGYVSPDPSPSERDFERVVPIEDCPVCSAALRTTDSGAWLVCPNAACPAKLPGKICNYLAKMRVKGVEESTVTRLVEAGLLDSISGLYYLDGAAVAALPGFGEKSFLKIAAALEAKREVCDWEFLGAWNWPGIGRSMMRKVMTRMTLADLKGAFIELTKPDFVRRISTVEGFSTITAGVLHDGLALDWDEIVTLLETNRVSIRQTRPDAASNEEVKSLNFVITGPLEAYERGEVQARLSMKGHTLKGSVSKKTDYLVTNTPNSGTGKNLDAQKLGIPIIGEAEFIRISGIAD